MRLGGAGMADRPGDDPAPGADEARVFVKAEHLQVTGSFKSRGAVNRVLRMTPEERARGIVTMSAGNHAGAVAYAAAAAGIPVTVVMPLGASRAKAEARQGYGATVELYGADVGETFQRLEQLRERTGRPVHPAVRRSGRHRGSGHRRPRDPRGPAGRGRRGRGCRRRRVALGHLGGGPPGEAGGARLRRGTTRQRCPQPGSRRRASRCPSGPSRSLTGWVPRSRASGPSTCADAMSTRSCSWTRT